MQTVDTEDQELVAEGPRFWTRETLSQAVDHFLAGRHLIVVSNREPYLHRFEGDDIVCERPVGGMVTALDPVMRVCGGSWVAHGSGSADPETADAEGRLGVPPLHPAYTLRRLWLNKRDEEDYYNGFANQALWPLCHIVYERPTFRAQDWQAYQRVNSQFAAAVLDEAADCDAIVLIQDYHLALLPQRLREARPEMLIGQFWHIPWPNREAFRICPWAREIVEGLLANDLLGFHIRYHCQNFLDAVAATIEAQVDQEAATVVRGGHRTRVWPFPISVDIDEIATQAMSDDISARMQRWRQQLGLAHQRVILGVDRIDYTKGIPERMRAIDELLSAHPEYLGKIRFVQIGAPSRTRIARYQELASEIESMVENINWKHAQGRWMPIIYREAPHSREELLALYRLADVCVVTPLHDGMNLVAKEYVSARADGDGVLVLSTFAGAARELEQSLQINPYAIDETAAAVHQALTMDEAERRARMAALRDTVARNNIFRWAGKIVSHLGRLAAQRHLEPAA